MEQRGKVETLTDRLHCDITIPFPSTAEATIAYNSLRVDPEPRRSVVSKLLSVNQRQLTANFTATEARLLRVAVGSFLDHLILVVDTMNRFGQTTSVTEHMS
ncbi:EKC/KEOPS complex subunit LAGE3-like [Dysidea avara]|uniref:EKC/KEOPS complex subunit LAGE3-like n=1 Tax=Dysidea avara TaxID=196820 RepID=UPI003319C4AC